MHSSHKLRPLRQREPSKNSDPCVSNTQTLKKFKQLGVTETYAGPRKTLNCVAGRLVLLVLERMSESWSCKGNEAGKKGRFFLVPASSSALKLTKLPATQARKKLRFLGCLGERSPQSPKTAESWVSEKPLMSSCEKFIACLIICLKLMSSNTNTILWQRFTVVIFSNRG